MARRLVGHPEVIRLGGTVPYLRIGAAPAFERPEHAKLIGECLMAWPSIELCFAEILAGLLKTDSPAAVAVYLKLRRRTNRVEAITAAAENTLDEDERDLLYAILRVSDRIEAQRNDLAHGHFGACDDLPDDILWINAEKYVMVRVDIYRGGPNADMLFHHLFYYTLTDLEVLADEIVELFRILASFHALLRESSGRAPGSRRRELFDQLTCLVPIQAALDDLRASAQKSAKSPS
jgi:hypothetical protein